VPWKAGVNIKMKTTIFLIRHGEIDNPKKIMYGGSLEMQITDIGRAQIKKTAEKIKALGHQIEKIYTSPMHRTMESSKVLALVFRIENKIIKEKNLWDVLIPALAGELLTIRDKIHAKGTDEYNSYYASLGNESREQIVGRMENAFRNIVKSNKGKTVAIVSHGDPIRFLLYRLDHLGEKVPSVSTLIDEEYVQKGKAVKIIVDETGKVVEKTFL